MTVWVPVGLEPVKFTLPGQAAEMGWIPAGSENGCEVAVAEPVTRFTVSCNPVVSVAV